MVKRISFSGIWGFLTDHYFFVLMVLVQAALAQFGVPDARSTGIVGVFLCIAGLDLQRRARIDPWIAVPMLVYLAMGMASSYAAYGNFIRGFPSTHVLVFAIYFLMSCLKKKELRRLKLLNALWAGAAACISLLMFLWAALTGTAGRLGGLLGNPNALGIYMAVGWCALRAWLDAPGERDAGGLPAELLRRAEPVILVTLALTLSMGSFLSLAVGILVLVMEKKRHGTWGETLDFACRILAKDTVCFAAGILMYFAARQTCIPWFALVIAVWLLVLAEHWEDLEKLLEARPWLARGLSGGGFLVAGAAVAIRPSALATFAERFDMMRNGLSYIFIHPILGLGPGQWREWNLYDGGQFFGTWHIHNFLIHIGVELGLIAMAMLVVIILRHFRKTGAPAAAAFLFHNLIDTSFFYVGITTLMLVSAGEPRKGGRTLSKRATSVVLLLLTAHFVLCFLYALRYYGNSG